jgi:hypothetical protein
MTRMGRCGLCLHNRELQSSHLLPAALYRMLRRAARGSDPDPVMVTPSRSLMTSRQVAAPFLCASCEGRLSQNGEHYVLSQCAHPDGRFSLREILETAAPLERRDAVSVYDVGSVLGKHVTQYLYFSASVFWRASAHTWYRETGALGQFTLGQNYQEQFRRYLLGQAPFPQDARMWVHVSSEHRKEPLIVFPCTSTLDGANRHKFYVPGILFILFLGEQRFDELALNGTRRSVMWVCPLEQDSVFRGVLSRIETATPVGKLADRVGVCRSG